MRVTIVNVDYSTNTITIDKNISWNQGDEVFADYKGFAPDVGAIEYDTTQLVGVNGFDKSEMNESFCLFQNFPNPFNPTTSIQYSINGIANVRLEIFDILGREVTTLVEQEKSKGTYSVSWNAKNNAGNSVTNGIYFCKLTVKGNNLNRSVVKKMIILK